MRIADIILVFRIYRKYFAWQWESFDINPNVNILPGIDSQMRKKKKLPHFFYD